MMQRLGERIDEEEQYAVKEMHADRAQGEKVIPVLFEEMDGIWLHMQNSNHRKMKKQEMKVFRYMDDDFMTACLEDNYEAVELILRIVLGQEDITIKSIRVQDSMKNLQGRSAILDVHAVDNTGKEFDCEIQRSDKGAGVKRARHNSSLLDAHILYVNGEYRDDSAIGKLMHDFNCADADDMHYGLLAERTRYLKENSKGVNEMYRTMDEVEKECYEEGREKGRETQAELTAINLRKLGLPLEQIAHAVGFHVEKVEKWVK